MMWLWEIVGSMVAGAVIEVLERIFFGVFRAVRWVCTGVFRVVRWVCRKVAGIVGREAAARPRDGCRRIG